MTSIAPPVFADALDDLMVDPALGVAATYTPPGGLPVVCQVVLRRAMATPGNYPSADQTTLAGLPRTTVPTPEAGATLVVDGTTYRVDGLVDDDGAVVTVAVRAL